MRFDSEVTLREVRRDWRALHVLAASRRAGLLDSLDEATPRSADDVARGADADARVTLVCLDVLVSSGLLRWDVAGYRFAPGARSTLAAFDEMAHEFVAIAHLLTSITSGRPHARTVGGVDRDDRAERVHFLTGLQRRALPSVPEAVRVVGAAWMSQGITERGPRILDLGGGHGLFAATFARELLHAEVTLFDQDMVLEHARALSGHDFATRGGDYFRDDLDGPYDVAFLSNVVHGEPPEDAARLLRRVRASVRDGGAIVLRDRFVQDDHTGPDWAIDFSITLVLYTDRGHARTVGEAQALLWDAGFGEASHHTAPSDEYAYMVARTRS